MGVIQTQVAEHQKDRDGDRDRRHHPCRQDEKQKVILERNS